MIRPDDLVSLSELLAGPPPARRPSWRSGWAALLIASFARAVLAILAGLVLWSLLPLVNGWHPSVVLSGSMQPSLHPGDIVITRAAPADRMRPGQIVLAEDPDRPGRLRLHRLVRFEPDGRLVLRGDANRADDSDPIPIADVRGIAVLRVPLIGRPVRWVHDRDYLQLAGLVGAGLVLLVLATRYRPQPEPEPEPEPTAGSGFIPEPERQAGPGATAQPVAEIEPVLAGPARLAARGAAMVLLLGLAAGQLVHPAPAHAARFSGKAGGTGSWAVRYFSCRSAVQADSPNLYYRFEESAGTTVTDNSSSGLAGTYSASGINYRTAGACPYDGGKSITLDGSNGYVYTNTQVANPGTFSSELWFRTTTARGGWLIGFGSSPTGASSQNDRQLYLTNSGQVCFGILGPTAKEILSPAGFNDGAWHLAVATFSAGTGMRLYLDGSLAASNASVTTARSYNGYIRIGYDSLAGWPSAPASSYFAGSIDEVAAFGSVLSAADISAQYAASN